MLKMDKSLCELSKEDTNPGNFIERIIQDDTKYVCSIDNDKCYYRYNKQLCRTYINKDYKEV